jgi:hypothetical protein
METIITIAIVYIFGIACGFVIGKTYVKKNKKK